MAGGVEWRPDGSVVLRPLEELRLAMLDLATMRRVRDRMVGEVGEEAAFEREKEATRFHAARFLLPLEGKPSRYGLAKRQALEALEDYALLLGMGRIELERLTPGESGSLLLIKPFDLRLVSAGVAGLMQELDGFPYESRLSGLGGDAFRLVLERAGGGRDAWEPPEGLRIPPPGEGEAAGLEGCPLCGLPTRLGAFDWNELYGTVEAGPGGRRVALLPAFFLEVMDRPARGKGPGHGGLVEEAAYAATRSSLEGGGGDAYESAPGARGGATGVDWGALLLRGWGVAADARTGAGGWKVTVLNPVHIPLIAGWLRALYTFAMGREPRLRVDGETSRARFALD